MNWGYKIVIASALFMGYIIFLVTKCMQQDIDLVDKHYYKEEIEYDKQIKKASNGLNHTAFSLKYESSQQQLALKFGETDKSITGKIQFFRPSNDKMDQVFVLAPDKTGLQSISTSRLQKGLWRIKIYWTDGKEEFFKEETVVL